MSGVPLNFFENRGFLVLNGEMARKLSVSLSRDSIGRYVIDAANLARDALITKLKGKLVYIKIDGATCQLRSFLGSNVQYYGESKSKVVVKTLTCADSKKKHSTQQMCEIFEATLQKFDVPKENVLCLVDNASSMTKTVERLNENDVPFNDPDKMHNSAVDEEVDSDDEPVMLTNIHHMRCAVHTLQLEIRDGLKQPQCEKLLTKTRHIVAKLRFPNVLAYLKNEKGNDQCSTQPHVRVQHF